MASEKQTWCRLEAKQQIERGLSAPFQLTDSSCYRPGASSVWIYWAQEECCSSLPSPTSINSPIIPSELTFSICVSFSLTHNDLSFSRTLADWVFIGLWIKPTEQLYCIQRMQRLYSPSSHLPSLPEPVSLFLICPSVSSLPDSSIWCFSAVSLFFNCCSYFFTTPHFSFLPSLVFIPLEHFTASTRACQLHTVVTASAPTTWQRGGQIDREKERLTLNSTAHTIQCLEKQVCWILDFDSKKYGVNKVKEKRRQREILWINKIFEMRIWLYLASSAVKQWCTQM